MPQFSYKARRRSGEVVEGMLDVADRPAALVQIERLGLFPVAIEAAKGAGAAVNDRPATTKLDLKALLPQSVQQSLAQKRKPRLQELATFTQQLANLLNNVPLSIWYDWKNDGTDANDAEHNFGTVFPDLQPKPAYRAMQTLTHELSGCRIDRCGKKSFSFASGGS